jgi:shikimate kinase
MTTETPSGAGRPARNLVLVGMMGAGKTTVGRILARRLGRAFADTDALVEARAGRRIPEIFAEDGEAAFRRLERAAIRRVASRRAQVVAIGGGALGEPVNVTALRATGELVLLDAEPAALAARAGRRPGARPLLAAADDPVATLTELQARRDRDYRAAAAHHVETGGRSPDEVADAVLEWARTQPGLAIP